MSVRHTVGFLLGVLLTPALVYGLAWSYGQAAGSFDPVAREITDSTRLYGGVALMGAVGLVIGIVVIARWASPLVSLIPAVTLVAWTAYFLADPDGALALPADLPPAGFLDRTMDSGLRILLGSGVFALLGLLLLVPMGTPRRWAGGRAPDEGRYEDDDHPAPPGRRRQPEYF
ncbi:hypothetical protein [Thermomonospora umbrina]|uniref:Uncharacterized protein n=1 Tax=Thermomonospora umbrina TaxID=111806 RepID=A0A3D9T8Q9_9ACTN|nr:hypothetical protein [Thermomonospora umbrina]REF00142.1 hypothetical protein DFJ69_5670 [Thermomonospora umbrina]